jgi:hypothetical protein
MCGVCGGQNESGKDRVNYNITNTLKFLSPLPEMFNRPAQHTYNYNIGPVLGFHI